MNQKKQQSKRPKSKEQTVKIIINGKEQEVRFRQTTVDDYRFMQAKDITRRVRVI